LNGIEICRRLLGRVNAKTLTGTLLIVPIVNVFGFIQQSRYLPDRRDLNRCFPGSAKGALASRLAHLFSSILVKRATHI
ncbi:succinylglutamate desuccinylase/aspartoacylase family protein, partial [Pseudoalteromonas sp. 41-MNA-CIBAN-0057]